MHENRLYKIFYLMGGLVNKNKQYAVFFLYSSGVSNPCHSLACKCASYKKLKDMLG